MTPKRNLIGFMLLVGLGLLMGQSLPTGYRLQPLAITTNDWTVNVGSNAVDCIRFTNQVCLADIIATNNVKIARAHFAASTTNTISSAGTNVANTIVWTSITDSNKTYSTLGGTNIHATEAGTYLYIASIIMKSANTEAVRGSIWFSKNGTNIANSATEVQFGEVAGAGVLTNLSSVIAVPIMIDHMSTNDYVQIHWWGSDAGMVLPHTAADSGPTRPASPAAIINVTKVSSENQ